MSGVNVDYFCRHFRVDNEQCLHRLWLDILKEIYNEYGQKVLIKRVPIFF